MSNLSDDKVIGYMVAKIGDWGTCSKEVCDSQRCCDKPQDLCRNCLLSIISAIFYRKLNRESRGITRKVVQIIPNSTTQQLLALCDDGTMWVGRTSDTRADWREISSIQGTQRYADMQSTIDELKKG